MTINYVDCSLRPAKIPNRLEKRIYLSLKLWANTPPLNDVSISYQVYGADAYRITEGATRTVRVTGTEASPEEVETWIVISGPQPPPARLEVDAVIEKDYVSRPTSVSLLMI